MDSQDCSCGRLVVGLVTSERRVVAGYSFFRIGNIRAHPLLLSSTMYTRLTGINAVETLRSS